MALCSRDRTAAAPEHAMFSEPRRVAAARWMLAFEGAAFTEHGSNFESRGKIAFITTVPVRMSERSCGARKNKFQIKKWYRASVE
jgi:hypothetical protein